ncbi:MAG: class B sortase [Oscillospiraceae bacterium]|nr:class B sortase [Oscillospiraceae bacterium]
MLFGKKPLSGEEPVSGQKPDKKKIIYIALICLLSMVFLGCAIYLIDYFVQTSSQSKDYKDLSSIVESIRQDMATSPDNSSPSSPVSTGNSNGEADSSKILPEYQPLYEMNQDLVGWIKIPDTQVDYPVVQTPHDMDYYLYKDFNKQYSQSGCIYVRESCNVFTPSDNVVIYGHRMNNGSMFADLMNYKKKSYWEAHQTIQFDTIYEHHTYQIISVFITSGDAGIGYPYHQFNTASNQSEFDAFLLNIKNLQLYDTGVDAQYGDMLITLSTCLPRYESPSNGRLVVVAKRVS